MLNVSLYPKTHSKSDFDRFGFSNCRSMRVCHIEILFPIKLEFDFVFFFYHFFFFFSFIVTVNRVDVYVIVDSGSSILWINGFLRIVSWILYNVCMTHSYLFVIVNKYRMSNSSLIIIIIKFRIIRFNRFRTFSV